MADDICEACGQGVVTLDPIYGILACDNCGRVFDDEVTQLGAHHQEGLVHERGGTLVGPGDSGNMSCLIACEMVGSVYHSANQDDLNKRDVMNKMKEITATLRVPHDKVEDVKFMLERLLDGEWGQGRWIEILVGACIYVAIRQSRLPLTLLEVASSLDCGVAELGRMYRRVLNSLQLELPETDPVIFFDRGINSLGRTQGLARDMIRKMSKQGKLLLECSRQWFITTGRRPLPVVAAVLALVAEANQVRLDFEDVVREVYSNPRTSRIRLKELKEALVGVAQKLPWGRDITSKTLHKHLPFLLKFLEVDMDRARKRKESAPQVPFSNLCSISGSVEVEPTCMRNEVEQGMNIQGSCCTVSEERTSMPETQPYRCGKGILSVELQLVQALKRKEVAWQAWPKSFLVSEDAHSRRCIKINAAMERILKAKQALLSRTCSAQYKSSPVVPINPPAMQGDGSPALKKPKLESSGSSEGTIGDLDWEDLVIEYLLLRGVNHAQLEDGYYKAALGVHHMQSTNQIDDDELLPYLRSKAEVNLLKSLQEIGDSDFL